jgi:hypothetical protein
MRRSVTVALDTHYRSTRHPRHQFRRVPPKCSGGATSRTHSSGSRSLAARALSRSCRTRLSCATGQKPARPATMPASSGPSSSISGGADERPPKTALYQARSQTAGLDQPDRLPRSRLAVAIESIPTPLYLHRSQDEARQRGCGGPARPQSATVLPRPPTSTGGIAASCSPLGLPADPAALCLPGRARRLIHTSRCPRRW